MISLPRPLLLLSLLASFAVPATAGFPEGEKAFLASNYVVALREFRLAAERGNADAQYRLGDMNRLGLQVRRDDNAAFRWYSKAAQKGHRDAQYELGAMYLRGPEVTLVNHLPGGIVGTEIPIFQRDYKQAFAWLSKAAAKGQAEAQYRLVGFYRDDGDADAVPVDEKMAASWLGKAAKGGHPEAQYELAQSLRDKDAAQALAWYRKAAEQKHREAQYRVGYTLYTGKGAARNHAEAALWLRRAAEQRHSDAIYYLGELLARGEGVDRDLVESYAWTKLADLQYHHQAKSLLNELLPQLSSEQIAEGDARMVKYRR